MSHDIRTTVAVLGAAWVMGACGGEGEWEAWQAGAPAGAEAAPILGTQVMEVTEADFYLWESTTVPAGLTTIRVLGEGPEFHHVRLVRIDGGRSMDEFLDRVSGGGVVPSWVRPVGGRGTRMPGGRSEATVELVPGLYALVGVALSADGAPRLVKGMAVPFTVTRARPPARAVVASRTRGRGTEEKEKG